MKPVLVVIILIFFLSIRFLSFYHSKSPYKIGKKAVIETTLSSEPSVSGRFQRFSIEESGKERLLITASAYPRYYYGDKVRISGVISVFSSSRKNQLPINKKVVKSMFLPKIEAVKNESSLIVAAAYSFRQKTITLFEETLPAPSSNLLLGIVFGIKEDMPKDFVNNIRLAGVMHVVAASGMNVTMTAGFFMYVLSIFFKRQMAIIASIGGVIFYGFISGFEPSIVRASIMAILAFSAQITGRQNLPVFALGLAGFIMLFFSPELTSDIGFQLSFLATVGIIYINPVLKNNRLINQKVVKSGIGEDVITTSSAQLATLPVLVSNFGIYSLFSLITNAVVLWTIPFLMILGGAGALIALFFQPLAKLIIYLAFPLLLYFEKVVDFFAGLGGIITFEYFPWQIFVGYYFFLFALIFLKKRN